MSFSHEQSVRISDIFHSNKSNFSNNLEWKHVNYLDTGSITNGEIQNIEFINLSEAKLPSRARRIVNKNDIIFSLVRPIQRHYGLIKNPGKNMVVSTGFIVLTPKTEEVSSNYVYHYLTQNRVIEELQMIAEHNTSAYPSLRPSDIESLQLSLPEIKEQRRIAYVLDKLTEKIELNNKINKTLEEMAQAIFKSWFVDFEPFKDGAFVESEMGRIPQGWNVKELNDFVEINMGQSPSGTSYNESKEGLVFYQGRTDFGTRFPTVRLYTSEPRKIAEKGDVLLSVRAPVGDINIARERCCIGRGLASVRCRYHFSSFTYYLLLNLEEKFEVFNHEGTVFGSINKESLMRMKSVIPPFEILEKFERIVGKLDSEIYLNSDQVTKLIEIRDSLLPKLMSGEIRVPLEEVTNAEVC